MTRRLLNLLTIISLLLFMAIVTLWVRSYSGYHGMTMGWDRGSTSGLSDGCIARGMAWPGYGAFSVWRVRDAEPVWWDETVDVGRTGKSFGVGPLRAATHSIAYSKWGGPYRNHKWFAFERTDYRPNRSGAGVARDVADWYVAAPFWFLALVAAAMPALWVRPALRRRRGRSRQQRGLCPFCGYDLRATPGRCPECGKRTQNAE